MSAPPPEPRPRRRWQSLIGPGAAALAVAGLAVLLLRPGGRGAEVDPALLDPASGGETTAFQVTDNVFGLSARNLGREERRLFEVGDSLFTQNWVTAPSSTSGRDGLGPLFNAQACASCHVRDGRGKPPEGPDDPERGLLLRLSVPGPDGRPVPHPVYGDQLQDRAILDLAPEGAIARSERPVAGRYGDGTPYTLLAPAYAVVPEDGRPAPDGLMISPRVAPQVVGMGLLEAIPEDAVRAAADPGDADADGVSGRANRVTDLATGLPALGRFGWKAGAATVRDQAASAFAGDIGITSSLVPDESCTTTQTACAAAPDGGRPEIDDQALAAVAFYTSTLAVPARRDVDDPAVGRGAEVFVASGCAACHTPTWRTGPSATAAAAQQVIHPYTDLLLHDMGSALADDRPDGRASGSEWRTPPLWGLGLIEDVNGHDRLLHDGRARGAAEAILWHGGEGRAARERFRTAPADDRAALIAFLESL